jgi:predicted ATPase
MSEPLTFYQQEKKRFEMQRDLLKKKINLFSVLRLGLFLLAFPVFYYTYPNKPLLAVVGAFCIIAFVFLVLRHQLLVAERKLCEQLISINKVEIDALHGQYSTLPEGAEFIDAKHFYSNDIDLFGKGSFFQYMNRTATAAGRNALAALLLENDPYQIVFRQEVIKELAEKISWRQRFLALAKMVRVEVDHKTIISWIHGYKSFLPSIMKYLPFVFASASILFTVLLVFNLVSFYLLVIWFFIGLLITFPYFQRINHLYLDAGRIKDTFKQYHSLLQEIEDLPINSTLALDQQDKIKSSKKKASVIFKEFSKILDAFDQRNNMLFGILGNGFFLWDIRQTSKIDAWVKTYQFQVESWFDVIAYFDAQISLSNYVYNHRDHHYPEIIQNDFVIDADGLGHPLLDKKIRVDNDFSIQKKDFHIITGANMAGKSTFLRTISLGLVMANIGLPVCAKKMRYSPIKLITSMRTSDSLAEESSYFYAEIMRLRFIVEQMEQEKYFIILDEILKGTNSKDKAVGSRKFVEKLVKSGSTGIIATHDLSLCDIEKIYPQIHNQYFDAKINNEELFFDYKLKDGICTNMNASFLLKKMDII